MRKAMAFSTSAVLALMSTAATAETEQRSFGVSAGGRFVLDTDWGEVSVETWGRDAVDVVVERSGKFEQLGFDEQDGTVTVRARKENQGLRGWFGSRGPSPVFRITVPARFDLDLRTAGGNMGIADIDGDIVAGTSGGKLAVGEVTGSVRAWTSGGSIRIAGADGSVDATTSGGSIRLARAGGPVNARTSGGTIWIGASQGPTVAHTSGGSIELGAVAGAIDARTTGGSISATLAEQPVGDSQLRTTGGSIGLVVAGDLKFEIDARTTGGRVSADLPNLAPVTVNKSVLEAPVNGGGPKLTLRTTGGSIRLGTL
ncbi:MAG: DUF4097 family beta strand repeat-containing protein [Gammaproteobacteria bacterium]|nr:DUF4097 family beta strand repeat-containing protein [Gammaproteobacteria bacterium]